MSEMRTPQLTLESYIEAMLFVAGEPVAIVQLAEWLDVSPHVVEDALQRLRHQIEGRGITLLIHDQRVQLVSHVIAAPLIRRMLGHGGAPKLTNAVSEVLTIIAYRQPITRAQIEAIRGVDCSTLVRQLQARELVTEVGRLESIGRPVLFGTTDHFLRQFGLQSLDELPPLVIPEIPEITEAPSADDTR